MTEKKAERPKTYIEDVQKPISLEDFEKLRDGNLLAARSAEGAIELIVLLERSSPGIKDAIRDYLNSSISGEEE